jgi:hypothetical protein
MWRWVEGCCSGGRGEVVSCDGGEAMRLILGMGMRCHRGGGGQVFVWF